MELSERTGADVRQILWLLWPLEREGVLVLDVDDHPDGDMQLLAALPSRLTRALSRTGHPSARLVNESRDMVAEVSDGNVARTAPSPANPLDPTRPLTHANRETTSGSMATAVHQID
jgi:hypothetical protein